MLNLLNVIWCDYRILFTLFKIIVSFSGKAVNKYCENFPNFFKLNNYFCQEQEFVHNIWNDYFIQRMHPQKAISNIANRNPNTEVKKIGINMVGTNNRFLISGNSVMLEIVI